MRNELVPVYVPRRLVLDVYRLVAEATADSGPENGRVEPDAVLMKRIYGESEGIMKATLAYLARRPGKAIPLRVLAKELRLERGASSLIAALGAFSRRAKHRYGGLWPFERGHGMLRMSPEAAAAIEPLLDSEPQG